MFPAFKVQGHIRRIRKSTGRPHAFFGRHRQVRRTDLPDNCRTHEQQGALHLEAPGMRDDDDTTSTPFDMVVMNDLDRFHLVADVMDRLPQLGPKAAYAKQAIRDKLIEHKQYVTKHGEDLPEIRNWKWGAQK